MSTASVSPLHQHMIEEMDAIDGKLAAAAAVNLRSRGRSHSPSFVSIFGHTSTLAHRLPWLVG
jgi:hypothetical protein